MEISMTSDLRKEKNGRSEDVLSMNSQKAGSNDIALETLQRATALQG